MLLLLLLLLDEERFVSDLFPVLQRRLDIDQSPPPLSSPLI